MNKGKRKILYRVFCFLSLAIAVYLVIDLKVSRTLDLKMIIVFILFLVVIIWGTIDWKLNNDIIKEQTKELMMYQLYIQPLEELVKEIRAKQHEFDNHLNAILNMHLTVGTYDELVKEQSEYIKQICRDGGNQYLPLLRISDKVLAGFLYSKIVSSNENIDTQIEVRSKEIISRVSEHRLIEIVGVLVDNAYEACGSEGGKVRMLLDSRQDHLFFQILNQHEKVSFETIGHFFENGYSTKSKRKGERGLGLYRAKMIAEKAGGEIMVGQEEIGGENYIQFTVVI
ncbi:GHKL domain-containing protein [Clostridium sp. AF19-22AC]|jgi:two-component system sensor histidine kinase AgrC|uniref:sensor histidine kinase n=1 Tax=Clostridia TaxID=186801 RepID=UPI000E4B91C2|nr:MULTISPECIES: ATP-binding protein [Clostridia]RHR29499.1 GHKL domain-containing protein [Clostridium sp. AF19-22AC]